MVRKSGLGKWFLGVTVLFSLLAVSRVADAQGLATLRGAVTDPSGAVVPSATATVTQVGTGFSRSVSTDSAGNYLFPSLQPSTYMLRVVAKGFRESVHSAILLQADQNVVVNVALEIGQSSQTVTVGAIPPQVDTTNGSLSQVIGRQSLVQLPLNGRNAASLVMLVAGAAPPPAGGGGALQGNSKEFPSQIAVSTNGTQEDQVSYQLDGGTYNDEFFSVNLPFPFPDALQEFSVQTSNYAAQYGQNSGGVVNIITKSGTNSIHGDAFEFVRNEVFDARNYFAARRDQLKRNQYGFTLGGPFVIPKVYNGRDHTFWFFGFQGTTLKDVGNTTSAFVPTVANLNGDFSAYLNASDPNNPLRKAVHVIDPLTGQPFPGNLIPVQRFDPAALGAEKFMPQPGGNGQVVFQSRIDQPENEVIARVDQSFGKADKFTGRMTWNNFQVAPVFNPQNILSLSGFSNMTSQNYLLHETHIFRPNLLNDLRLTYWRLKSSRGPAPGSPNVADFGVHGIFQTVPKTVDSVAASGFFSFGENPLAAFVRQGYALADDVNWVRGRHSLQFGGTVELSRFDLVNKFVEDGTFSFTSDVTNLALASFLLGNIRTFQQGGGEPANIRDVFSGVYAQDTFQVSPRLTLNFGLRYEPEIPWTETHNRFDYFKPANYYAGVHSQVFVNAPVGLLFYGDPGVPRRIGWESDLNNVMPRFGFSLDVFGDGKTAIRGGSGLFYDTRIGGAYTNTLVGAVSPFAPFIQVTQPAGPFSNPYLGITNPFPAVQPPPKDVAFPRPLGGGNGAVPTVDTSHKNIVTPLIYNWNLTIEHQVAAGWLARVGYVGGHGSHIRELVNLNPAVYIPGSKLSTDARRMFQTYSNINQTTMDVTSSYNSLQVSLEKRFLRTGIVNGLTLLANYTYGKSMDDLPLNAGTEGTGISTIPWTMPEERHRFDYGPSDFNHTHILVVSYDWPLPAFQNFDRVARLLIGNWEYTGVFTANSGFPMTVVAGKDQSQTGLGADRGVKIGTPKGPGACGSKSSCVNYLNPSSFELPAIGTFGNVGKGSISGPGLVDWDMGLFKNIPLGERFNLQFRAEFFNALNHANFNNPSTTVSSGGFGAITGAGDPRIGQLALKLLF